MAKGAAKEQSLGQLHERITQVFIKVMDRYERRLDALDSVTASEIEDEILREIFEDGALPNPAMLSAVTKFLKDNEISFDTAEIDQLSSQERRLAERREKRKKMTSLTDLPVAGHG